jgi:hypothetical protein
MKLIITTITFIILLSQNTLAEEKNCNQYDKLSKEYAKCNSLLLKNKTLGIKDKFNKSNLKKKLLKFKNSKSHKEYKEN